MFFHFCMVAPILLPRIIFFQFLYSFYCKKAAKNEKKNIVEENSENDEEHNDENYDYITDRSFEASRLL